jgi:DMSO reductase anchor subunit
MYIALLVAHIATTATTALFYLTTIVLGSGLASEEEITSQN